MDQNVSDRKCTPELCPPRYSLATMIVAAMLMLGALHIPVDSILPESFELFFYPSFIYFLPLSVGYSKLMPGGWELDSVPASLLMCGFDLILAALFALPFLFPSGRKQTISAALSMGLLLGYSAVAGFCYFRMHGV